MCAKPHARSIRVTMPIESNLIFADVSCTEKGTLLSHGKLSLNISFFDNSTEISQLAADRKNIIFDDCICEFEYVFEQDHNQKKIQTNRIYDFYIRTQNSTGSKTSYDETVFSGLFLTLSKVVKIEDSKNQRYFYQGVKIKKYQKDHLHIFDFFGCKKLFVRFYDRARNCWRAQVVNVTTRSSLLEIIEDYKQKGFYDQNFHAFDITSVVESSNNINDAEIIDVAKYLT